MSNTEEDKTLKIGVAGCTGRVGKLVVQELISDRWSGLGLELSGGSIQSERTQKFDFFVTRDANELFQISDVVIDFTSPAGARTHAEIAAELKKPLVIGATGMEEEDERALQVAAENAPILYSANMSIGTNILMAYVEQAAARLGIEWDIEIFETHHKLKVDAPSGTALMLGRAAAKGRGERLESIAAFARHGKTGIRAPGAIGFAVARGGDVVGEHKVTFFGEGERIEFGHIATDRSLFARGAIRAAQWLSGKKPGLYSMRDVLDL